MPSALQDILTKYRATSLTEREKGTYFEELIRTYFRFEASYADLYSDVWLYADWAKEVGTPQFGFSGKDTGIDLVAKTRGTAEYHAIQCKCYAPDQRVHKSDVDSFLTASGQKPFTQRIIVTTTDDWTENAENALRNQQPPVFKIDLHDLENSQIDWAKFQPSAPPTLKPKYALKPHQVSARADVVRGLQTADRGKLIMACGTGKTLTSLKIAEEVAGKNKLVLFLVPSLNLLSQTRPCTKKPVGHAPTHLIPAAAHLVRHRIRPGVPFPQKTHGCLKIKRPRGPIMRSYAPGSHGVLVCRSDISGLTQGTQARPRRDVRCHGYRLCPCLFRHPDER